MSAARWARILIVEPSAEAAGKMSSGISNDPRLAVAGAALNADDAVNLQLTLLPDVMTVDLALPDESAFDVIARVLQQRHLPIIAISAVSDDGSPSLGFRALLAGAADVIPHPSADAQTHASFFADLNERIASLAQSQSVPTHPPLRVSRQRLKVVPGAIECVVVGASTGGPNAVMQLLAGLDENFPVPILVVQHIAAPFVEGLVKWLNAETRLHVKLADPDEPLVAGTVYVARPDNDLKLKNRTTLSVDGTAGRNRKLAPSVDALFESAARVFGSRCAAVLLSGMGKDGAAGLLAVRAKGGKTFAQDQRTSIIYGMPGAAVDIGAVECSADPPTIAALLISLLATSKGSLI
jgi:two-component system, chemotaxis family, protein-glutamate methylesterase/glutaminase